MTNLATFKTYLESAIGDEVDSSTWTDELKEEALRRALLGYDQSIVYETSFTVVTSGYDQDLSSIADLKEILAVAYPWEEGIRFSQRPVPWRYESDQKILLSNIEPQSGETIRVRYHKLHTIEDLDGAASSNIPDRHDRLVTLGAAAWLMQLRIRQLSENPAIPSTPQATSVLMKLEMEYRQRFQQGLSQSQTRHNPVWSNIGL